MSDVIQAYPGREGKEGGREREKKEAVRYVSVYICPKLHKPLQSAALNGGLAHTGMLKRRPWGERWAPVWLQLCTADDNIKY